VRPTAIPSGIPIPGPTPERGGRSTQVLTVNYFYNLYDSLLRWDTAMQLQPGLATAWRAVNDTTWEFTLRSGVKFPTARY
jgi:ABC-type transport system substrate-binding protein